MPLRINIRGCNFETVRRNYHIRLRQRRQKTSSLIEELLVPAFANEALSALGDGAILPGQGDLVFSTDSYVISPYFFPGGDIGKLSVCGTVNDISMCGGTPKYLSLGFILEEGLPVADLRRIVASIAETAQKCGVQVVTGDTKVVERGKGDGIYINTAGIGTPDLAGFPPKHPGGRRGAGQRHHW